MNKIVFFEVNEWEIAKLQETLKDVNVKFYTDRLDDKHIDAIKDIDILSVWIYSRVTRSIIDKLPNLKLIVTRSTGMDHIDVDYCYKKGIQIANIPKYGINTVAEHTFALILNLIRKVHKTINRKDFSLSQDILGFELKDKTIGVVGTGSIGRKVIHIAKAFDMHVLAYDIKKDEEFAREYNFKYVELDELLMNSDIITLHVPLNKDTYHMINMNNIKKIKKGCYLINTARGSVCDTTALLYGLEEGIFAGLALDVLEEELLFKEDGLSILYENTDKIKKKY
ncbi:MAG: lactate dehydrogenase [Candidatus Nitrosocaldaceae archaeon]|nr:MAG: lactate dehydrogenase [Candidatus Nitrosocaldaceae archaeon]